MRRSNPRTSGRRFDPYSEYEFAAVPDVDAAEPDQPSASPDKPAPVPNGSAEAGQVYFGAEPHGAPSKSRSRPGRRAKRRW